MTNSIFCKEPLFFAFRALMDLVREELAALGLATYEAGAPRSLSTMYEEWQDRFPGVKPPPHVRDALALRNKLVNKNSGLVYMVAKRQNTRAIEEADHVQAGFVGCIRAVESYNPERAAFSTYATPWIRHYIQVASAGAGAPLRAAKGNSPHPVFVSTESSRDHSSAKNDRHTDEQNLGDTLGGSSIPADEQIEEREALENLTKAIAALPLLEADLIQAKYFDHESSDSIERRVRAGREAIRGRKISALDNLRKILEASDYPHG